MHFIAIIFCAGLVAACAAIVMTITPVAAQTLDFTNPEAQCTVEFLTEETTSTVADSPLGTQGYKVLYVKDPKELSRSKDKLSCEATVVFNTRLPFASDNAVRYLIEFRNQDGTAMVYVQPVLGVVLERLLRDAQSQSEKQLALVDKREAQRQTPTRGSDRGSLGYDDETRGTMELACVSEKTRGPVAYGACLNRQIASLQSSPGIPKLSGYEPETRVTMELACGSEKMNGPVAYGACLNRQIASLQGSPSIPNPRGYENEAPRTTLPTPSGGTAVHSANGSGTDVSPQVKDGWLQVSEDLSFRPDSIKLGDKEISVLMQLKTPDDQLHLSIVGVPYKVCSQGYGKIRFYDLSHVFQADADAALNGNSHGSYVATMLCAVRSGAVKPK
jgi:hypothetical protein